MPSDLIEVIDSVMVTYQPTWDDCQQLLETLFIAEERDGILGTAWKLVWEPRL